MTTAPVLSINDELLDEARKKGLSIDGDNAYKRDLIDCIVGAMALGYQNANPPPTGHWLGQFWDIGQAEGRRAEQDQAQIRQQRAELERLRTAPMGVPDGFLFVTHEQLERHATTAWECPPQSRVVLVSSISRLHDKNAAAPSPIAQEGADHE
ncbi:hypothetical protein SAMN05216201_11121 [Pseudomonas linyingensis]|uniref:Uncharacterized protein n=1 Tax=Pseudomonas linyingensis TaxID=915471 RepID=A0A1H6ZU44_9PSED|nr:hypothetical protein [Pseudomonas linyingensis]SEJ56851.1 hypothetical protein SAMN05216201_11121 [Pseudomonas linyingensis]